MDYAQLRTLLEPLVTGLKDAGTHTMLPTLCEELGLPAPTADGSKRERMTSSFDAVADTYLTDSACPPIPKRYRREVARRLNSEDLYGMGMLASSTTCWSGCGYWMPMTGCTCSAGSPRDCALRFSSMSVATRRTGQPKRCSTSWAPMTLPIGASRRFWRDWLRPTCDSTKPHNLAVSGSLGTILEDRRPKNRFETPTYKPPWIYLEVFGVMQWSG